MNVNGLDNGGRNKINREEGSISICDENDKDWNGGGKKWRYVMLRMIREKGWMIQYEWERGWSSQDKISSINITSIPSTGCVPSVVFFPSLSIDASYIDTLHPSSLPISPLVLFSLYH